MPNFDGSLSIALTSYQKILPGCSFGYKSLLNFNRTTMKFQDRHHTNGHNPNNVFPCLKLIWIPQIVNADCLLDLPQQNAGQLQSYP
jgi:hypothetical protein